MKEQIDNGAMAPEQQVTPDAPKPQRTRRPRNGSAPRKAAEPATVAVHAQTLLDVRGLAGEAERFIVAALRELSFSIAQSDADIGAVRSLMCALASVTAIVEVELAAAIAEADPEAKEGGAS